jgi:hypothetical protein
MGLSAVVTLSQYFFGAPPRRRHLVKQGWARTLSPCGFGCSLRFLPLQFFPRLSAAPIIGGMWFLALRKLAVTASWSGGSVLLLRTFLVQVAAPAPRISGRLFAVGPNVAELLAVVTLCESAVCFISFHLDCNVAEASQLEDLVGFRRSRQSYEEKGEVYYFGYLRRGPTSGCHLLDANNVEAEAHQPVTNVFCLCV